MRKWFGKRKDAGRRAQPSRDRKRVKGQPVRGNTRRRKRDFDAEQDFITRYGDPFDDV
jgi:hypothetical protein